MKLDTSDMYVNEKGRFFQAILTQNNTPMANEEIIFSIDSVNYTKLTNDKGLAELQLNLNPGTYAITTRFENLENQNTIFMRDSNTIFIAEGTTNDEIQKIIDSSEKGKTLEFIGKNYRDISLQINKQLNLVSNCGATLEGINNKPVISISGVGASGTKISGLNLIGGSAGINVNLAYDVELSSNSISNSENGIVMGAVSRAVIKDNTISNTANNAISLKDSSKIEILQNSLTKNTNGIYYDVGNEKITIFNNTIRKSSQWGINLDKSGEYSSIIGNTIRENENGISINCKAEGLAISQNYIGANKENGINFGPNYRKTQEGEDPTVVNNVIIGNGHMNILAKESIYTEGVSLGGNWVGSSDRAFSGVCSRIKMTLYELKVTQTGPGSFEISVGENGVANDLLPAFGVSVSEDGGKSFSVVTVSDGKALVHVSNEDGTAFVRTDGPMTKVKLENYVPYQKPTQPTQPSTPANPSVPSSNGTQQGSGSAIGGEAVAPGSSDSAIAASSAQSSSSNAEGSDAASAEQASASSPSQGETLSVDAIDSQSVAKSITVDEEFVKIAGIGAIILLIVIVIGAYYRRDVKDMLNNKKGI